MPKFLPDRERKLLGPYVRDLANRMGLRDWTIHLMHEPTDDADAWADVTPLEGRKHANIRLCRDWAGMSPADKRHALVHELIHCHLAPVQDAIRLDLVRPPGQTAYDLAFGGYRRTVEYAVDGLADAVGPLMPSYPDVSPKPAKARRTRKDRKRP